MKRRDFVKLIPTVALASATGCGKQDAAVPASTTTAPPTPDTQSSTDKRKGFSISNRSFKDPGANDVVHCDQFGIDPEGKPIADNLTGTGSDAGLKQHDPDKPHKMTLTQEEQDILNGSKGETMAKVLKTIVKHGELFGAERLVDCNGAPHSSLYTGGPWVEPVLEMFEEIADAGLKAHAPYTVNPMPLDLYTVGQDPVKRNMMLDSYPMQGRLIQVHTRLGARPLDVWSCACYLPEVGNIPETGSVVSWAESSAVNYGNSVLGLRINRMATGMEVLCAIAGKVPAFGVLVDEGRKAKWHIDVRLSKEPHWGALGGAVGTKVVEQIPYVTGIDQWIGMKDGAPDLVSMGKLKAFGSSTASSGAVGLYHVENITPEAKAQGRDLLTDDYQTYVIDDAELERVMGTFQNLWKDPEGDPTAVYLGCPHNTYEEILYWSKKLDGALKEAGQDKVAIPVIMACPIVVRNKLLDQHPILLRDVLRAGIHFTTICTPAYQGLKGMADIDRGVTNSNKARFYSRLRLFGDDDLLQIAMTGKLPA
ncbi:aconitase X [Biformimicrobium ophioploci]|uniref:Aconitase X n=1 Tax=Biformimicrobium ophioploci TaxID=3036711 RepID=A0ABQ6M0C2_9GAMM|nr:aconitase X [Microbulbifer sp. NKW57]GMG87795.1 aconitase X [Microbulbifer sp. NKW57]